MSVSAMPVRWSLTRAYALEAKYELLKLVRMPAYAIPSIAFPVVFYTMFGLVFGGRVGGVSMATYLVATYGAFGVIGAALFGFGVGVAVERGQGWMLLKRAARNAREAAPGRLAARLDAVCVARLPVVLPRVRSENKRAARLAD